MGKKEEILVDGAYLTCSLGCVERCILKIGNQANQANGMKIATILDNKKDNFDFSNCKRDSKNPPPCIPSVQWTNSYSHIKIENNNILTIESQAICKYGGKIRALHSGQRADISQKTLKTELNRNLMDLTSSSYRRLNYSYSQEPSTVKQISLDNKNSFMLKEEKPRKYMISMEESGKIILIAEERERKNSYLINWIIMNNDKKTLFKYSNYGPTISLPLNDNELFPPNKERLITAFGVKENLSKKELLISITRKENIPEKIVIKNVNNKILDNPILSKHTTYYIHILYTFNKKLKNKNDLLIWTLIDQQKNTLYTSVLGESVNSSLSIERIDDLLKVTFSNTGKYTIKAFAKYSGKEYTLTYTFTVKNRTVDSIINHQAGKIRIKDSIHLSTNKISNDYGLGENGYWYVSRKGKKSVFLACNKEIKMTGEELYKVYNKNSINPSDNSLNSEKNSDNDIYGLYYIQVFGEEKNPEKISTSNMPQNGKDYAIIEISKNRLESIEGALEIPLGAEATYQAKALIPMNDKEIVKWKKGEEIINTIEKDSASLLIKSENEQSISLSASLEGEETNGKPINKEIKFIKAELVQAQWAYKNGTKKLYTFWGEENYIYLLFKGIKEASITIHVWAQYVNPNNNKISREDSVLYASSECFLETIESKIENGKCHHKFIINDKIKEKILSNFKNLIDVKTRIPLFFTFELGDQQNAENINYKNLKIFSQSQNELNNLPYNELNNLLYNKKINYLPLDINDLLLPGEERVISINFTSFNREKIHMYGEFGKTHYVWVHTIGLHDKELKIKIYKRNTTEDYYQTFDEASKSFEAFTEVLTGYNNNFMTVENDGLLEIEFIPEKEDPEKDERAMYVVKVFMKIEEGEEGNKQIIEKEIASQIHPLNHLPYDLTEDFKKLSINIRSTKEMKVTNKELKKIMSKYLHFYNPLYVKDEKDENVESIISIAYVERADNLVDRKNCYCYRDFKVDELKRIVETVTKRTSIWNRATQLDDKNFNGLTRTLNFMFKKYNIQRCIQKIAFLAQVNAETDFFDLTEEQLSRYASSKSIYKGRGILQLTGNIDNNNLYNEPGLYANYGKEFISKPEKIAQELKHTVYSGGFLWSIKSCPIWKDKGKFKWKRDKFKAALGQYFNGIADLIEIEEDEKYFWLISKLLNGFPVGETETTVKNPNGWEKRKSAFELLKKCLAYDKKNCKANNKWHDPVDNPTLTTLTQSGYTNKRWGLFGKVRNNKVHQGVDLSAEIGTNVYACVKGKIREVKSYNGYGTSIMLEVEDRETFLNHKRSYMLETTVNEMKEGSGCNLNNPIFLFYAHLDKVYTDVNQEVNPGDIIGLSGVSGITNGTKAPHLHFEIFTNIDAIGKGLKYRYNPGYFIYYNKY